MTATMLPRTDPEQTPESQNLARLRAMLGEEKHRADWPEIQQAIDYLIAETFVKDLAA